VQPSRYPILANNIKLLANEAFILRWENGIGAPLNSSCALYVNIVIKGLEQLVEDA
jgi:hypothetical protein